MNEQDKLARDLICGLADEYLSKYGQFVCDVSVGVNSVGDPSLFVEICYSDSVIPVLAVDSVLLNSQLRENLLKMGESRFPYLTYLIDQDAA